MSDNPRRVRPGRQAKQARQSNALQALDQQLDEHLAEEKRLAGLSKDAIKDLGVHFGAKADGAVEEGRQRLADMKARVTASIARVNGERASIQRSLGMI